MTDPRYAWLRVERIGAEPGTLRVSTADVDRPTWTNGAGDVVAVAFATPGSRVVTQAWRLDPASEWRVRVGGRLDRPALAEITEINPPNPTGALTVVRADGSRLVLSADALPAVAVVDATAGRWSTGPDGAELLIGRGAASIEISVSLTPGRELAESPTPPATPPTPPATPGTVGRAAGATDSSPSIESMVARAVAYVRGCTALSAGPGERAILTDHRLLPLSWTRDAYYQALLLVATGQAADREVVADHLRWLWSRCERPNGRWTRSHHGDGRPKDLAFQADQQLYPFVELADYRRATGTLPGGTNWSELVPAAWLAVLTAIDPVTGLMATDENSADDRVEAPFVAASQILLWYAASRLAELARDSPIGLLPDAVETVARRARSAFHGRLVVGDRWAYAVDGHGRAIQYHDANDLPTALAPLWGFCPRDDPAWRATMAFAYSPANRGFVPGPDGGLGSDHTPGMWPLGLVQDWLVATIVGDEPGATDALDRLGATAFTDGMLPEAVRVTGRECVPVRHWFAWPGAALAGLWLLAQRGELSWLSVTPLGRGP